MPSMASELTVEDIQQARLRIAEGIYASPCPESIPLSEICGARIYCKLEYLQRTGSFKERGARNALAQLNQPQRMAGVIAASAGNHGKDRAPVAAMINLVEMYCKLGIKLTYCFNRFR